MFFFQAMLNHGLYFFLTLCLVFRKLQSPNVVAFHGCYREDTDGDIRVALVMEYCSKTLRDIIKNGLSPANFKLNDTQYKGAVKRVGTYAMEICSGLSAIHENHHVHRDLRPENILVSIIIIIIYLLLLS